MDTIANIKKDVFFNSNIKDMKVLLSEYKQRLRTEVSPETYVEYILHQQRDLDYIDLASIFVVTTHVYPDTTPEQIRAWVLKHKTNNQHIE